jgi:hypothetical protein
MQELKLISLFNVCSNAMDKSWMTKFRISKEYRDECRSFVDFAIQNCKTLDGLLFCPCKTCHLNRRHTSGVIHNRLTWGEECGPNTKTEFIMARGLYELQLKALI